MASAVTLVAALITCIGTVAAALITTRQHGPAGTVPVTAAPGASGTIPVALPGQSRTSKAFWLGIASLFLWIIPLLGYCVIIPGLYIGIREMSGPRRRTGAGLVMCGAALFLAVINSAIGAYQGAHGQLWFQQG